MAKPTVGMMSLGCPRNLVDSEYILGRLAKKGHRIVDITKAQVAILNTCAFVQDAKKESIDAILDLIELKKKGALKKILVYGCLTQRYQDLLRREFPEVDGFVGKVSLEEGIRRLALTPRHYAYLKICEGCINSCSFCVIPKIKGRFASLAKKDILEKVGAFDRQRLAELNIIGQDITGYGFDLYKKADLSGLMRQIVRHSRHIHWLRLLYLYPSRINDELLKLVRDEPRICKYIDVPIQHSNDRILRSMNRHTTRKLLAALIARIRKIVPDVALRTAVIVGFPTETDKEFKDLLGFITEHRFERLGAFLYSREEGTPAYRLKHQVPLRVQQERFDAVMRAQQVISSEQNARFLGKELEVLIDEKEKDHYVGRSQYDAPEVDGQVYIRSKRKLQPGDFVVARITDTMEYDLAGEV